MFKKITIIASGLILCLAVVAGCADNSSSGTTSSAEADAKIESIKQAGKLILATSADYPPFETHTIADGNDEITGWDIDLAKLIAEKLGVELEINDLSFDAVLTALGSGQADLVIAGLGQTAERDESFDPSIPYYTTTNVMLVAKGQESTYSDLASFAGKKIGAQEGTLQVDLVKEFLPDSQPDVVKNIADLVLALKSGQIDGLLLDSPVASDYINANADLAIADAKFEMEGSIEPKVVYFQKGNAGLVELVNQVITDSAGLIYPAL